MDIFTALSPDARYSNAKLQMILGAWVTSALFDRKGKVTLDDGDVDEDDYTKQSIYALLYSIYREVGMVTSEHGTPYEFTFNTWGYDWPSAWGPAPTHDRDPERFGKYAYAGLFSFEPLQAYIAERQGRFHIVEMGCGTGAGAHYICDQLWPHCTYTAIDMQGAAIQTCERKFVPALAGRLSALHGDATQVAVEPASADVVLICETHITEHAGQVTDEDQRFFDAVMRTLKPGGFLAWGNAIPDCTWQPCFDYLERIGMRNIHCHDVTRESVRGRDLDEARIEAFVGQCIDKFIGFRIPVLGAKRSLEAERALKNFARHPGTRLYENMVDGTDSYRVALFQKPEVGS